VQDKSIPQWFLYLIECQNGSIYTGITTNIARRYTEHLLGKGARYTRAYPPRELLAVFSYPNRAAATQAEYATKQLSACAKRQLVDDIHNQRALYPLP
jgi:putative endonuclease